MRQTIFSFWNSTYSYETKSLDQYNPEIQINEVKTNFRKNLLELIDGTNGFHYKADMKIKLKENIVDMNAQFTQKIF